jgi:hypothetical protein
VNDVELERVEKFSFFARLSEEVLAQAKVNIVLVGGSAVEWHFPELGASLDLDIVVQAISSGPRRAFEQVLTNGGWTRTGKVYAHAEHAFTIDVVASVLHMGVPLAEGDVVTCEAPNGRPFRVLSPTMMWCDRLMAWEALPASDRDASASLEIVKRYGAKLDFARARDVLEGNGVLETLRSRIALSSKWKAVRFVLKDWRA